MQASCIETLVSAVVFWQQIKNFEHEKIHYLIYHMYKTCKVKKFIQPEKEIIN